MAPPAWPPVRSSHALLAAIACISRVYGRRADEECNVTGTQGSALIQQKSTVRRDMLLSDAQASCYGELPGLAVSEGNGVGKVVTQSASECRRRCSGSSQCQSASFCPRWNGCWLKDRGFSGGEPVRTHGDCRTLYKRPCGGETTPPPRPTLPPRPPAGGAVRVRVVSYNMYWWNAFDKNPWKGRKITDNIRHNLHPDVLGLQECDSPSLIQRRTGYAPASRFSGAQGVLVKPGVFTVGDMGSRDIGASGKWGPRFVTWAQLTHKQSGHTFWHFNTHWCVHSGRGRTCSADKRYRGAKNMLQVVREKAGDEPVIITGDFNAGLQEPGPRHFLHNGYTIAKWNWVDGVFYSTAHWRKRSARTGSSSGSDHRPVVAELELK